MAGLGKLIMPISGNIIPGWQPQADWVNISAVANNEINLLMGDFGIPTIAFDVIVASSGTYTINWGDSTIETLRNSGATYQHTYAVGTGQPCSLGYTTFKIRIYNASGNITGFQMKRHNLTNQIQYNSLLWAAFGTVNLTDLSYAFSNGATSFYASSLQSVLLPAQLNSLTTMSYCFYNCTSLVNVVMPTSASLLADLSYCFRDCQSLISIVFPSNSSGITTLVGCFDYCNSIISVTFPSTLDSLTTMDSCFSACNDLNTIILPNSSTSLTIITNCFVDCYSLKTLTNINNLGSITSNVNGTSIIYACESLSSVIMGAKFSKFECCGQNGSTPNRINSIRLTNANSLFAGSSPQINVTYNNPLAKAAIELLFGDIPNALTGKTIAITGDIGDDTLIYKSSSGTTTGSTTITVANTSSLSAGMEVYGTGISTAQAVTLQDTGDTVTLASHGLTAGMQVSFATIVTTTGITINTPYFVVNPLTNTFQVSLTAGGAALPLTTDGSGTIITFPLIVSITPSTNIIIDRPCSATASVTMTAGLLLRSIALLKGWTVTN